MLLYFSFFCSTRCYLIILCLVLALCVIWFPVLLIFASHIFEVVECDGLSFYCPLFLILIKSYCVMNTFMLFVGSACGCLTAHFYITIFAFFALFISSCLLSLSPLWIFNMAHIFFFAFLLLLPLVAPSSFFLYAIAVLLQYEFSVRAFNLLFFIKYGTRIT